MDRAGVKSMFEVETASLVGELANEFWALVPEAEKAQFLMAVLEKHYSGNASVVAELASLLKESGSDYKFWSWC